MQTLFKFIYRTGKMLLLLSTAALTTTSAVGYTVKTELNSSGIYSAKFNLIGVILGGISFLWASYIICFSGCKRLRKTTGGFKTLGTTYILFAIALFTFLGIIQTYRQSLVSCFQCPSCSSIGAVITNGVCSGSSCICSQQCFAFQTGCFDSCNCYFSSSNVGSCAVSKGYNSTVASSLYSGFQCQVERDGKYSLLSLGLVVSSGISGSSFLWLTAIYYSKAFAKYGNDMIEMDHAPGAY